MVGQYPSGVPGDLFQSIRRAPEALTTPARMTRSRAIKLMNSSGLMGDGTVPISVSSAPSRAFQNTLHLCRHLVNDRATFKFKGIVPTTWRLVFARTGICL